jgi:hypothetical protein
LTNCLPEHLAELRPKKIGNGEANSSGAVFMEHLQSLTRQRLSDWRQKPLCGNARVKHISGHRRRSSRCISSEVGKGPDARGRRLRIRDARARKSLRRANSLGVGTFCLSRERTSIEIELLCSRARSRSASYSSSGTFSTYKVGIVQSYGKSSTGLERALAGNVDS